MKRFWKNAYAIVLAILCAASFACAAYFAYVNFGAAGLWACIVGGAASLVLAPLFHELGHIVFAKINGFDVVLWKIFIVRYDFTGEKRRLRLCSPFAADQTQASAKRAYGDMKKRAAAYTAGGLIFGGAFLLIVAIFALASSLAGVGAAYAFFGAAPYAAYLFLLNLPPFEYAGGKTDMRVLCDILKDKPCGVRFCAAMNAQGELAEGKPYSKIDRAYLENLPAIAEDEPLFAMNEFYLYFAAAETRDYESAAKHINRIATLSPYLTDEERRFALCELTYLNAILSDETQAEKCFAALCGDSSSVGEGGDGVVQAGSEVLGAEVLKTSAENRAAAAYYVMRGDFSTAARRVETAETAARKEKFSGAAESEKLLLQPITERLGEGA